MINRFYDIQNGSITYDGIDVKLIKKDDLRHSLGIVLQDTNLFTGTIMDNIRYGKLDATDEECIAAAKLANAHDFIKHLEHGYQTQLTAGGQSLSQGQRQLLSIARAAVANPPVLILDEATSSIDTRTEKIVQDGMDKLMEGRTVFVIAHRLSTIQNSDAIMVLENGRIIERGNHDELLKQKVHTTSYTQEPLNLNSSRLFICLEKFKNLYHFILSFILYPNNGDRYDRYKRIFQVTTILGTLFLIGLILYFLSQGYFTDSTKLQALLNQTGIFAPLLFILLQIFQVIIPIIPGGASSALGIVAFGPIWGFVYNYAGLVIGSILAFLLVKIWQNLYS